MQDLFPIHIHWTDNPVTTGSQSQRILRPIRMSIQATQDFRAGISQQVDAPNLSTSASDQASSQHHVTFTYHILITPSQPSDPQAQPTRPSKPPNTSTATSSTSPTHPHSYSACSCYSKHARTDYSTTETPPHMSGTRKASLHPSPTCTSHLRSTTSPGSPS